MSNEEKLYRAIDVIESLLGNYYLKPEEIQVLELWDPKQQNIGDLIIGLIESSTMAQNVNTYYINRGATIN